MKFAYLIIAHNNEWQLIKLLELLDDKDNEIYLHIDQKVYEEFDIEQIKKAVDKSILHIYSKYAVWWGNISLTECQMFLLQEAVQNYHDYYHLISGSDLPLKTNEEIQKFFIAHKGKQLVHFESDSFCMKENSRLFFLFEKYVRQKKLEKLNKWCLNIQRRIGVQRHFYCGSEWFSITHDLAKEYANAAKKMLRKVRYTRCSDELILQTYLRTTKKEYDYLSEKEDDYSGIMRAIDWKRGEPYVWRGADFEELMDSGMLFARKFDEKIDKDIIEKIYRQIKGNDELYG